jgi:S1-C subfamily serine protease
MNTPSVTRSEKWKNRLIRLRAGVKRALPFTGGVIAAFMAILVYNFLFPQPHQLTRQEMQDTVAQALASATPAPAYSAQVYQIIQPSLVLIQTKGPEKDGKSDDGLGSGVVIDDAGDIMTSLHVVTDTVSIKVTFADGTESSAQVTDKQPEIDIAILRADQPPAQIFPATLGNPGSMRVGDEAYAVGNPFGLYSSMSAGVISGFNRSFEPPGTGIKLQGLIQIDTAVNPGNSGGPLLNRYGQVIGIVEGIVNPTGQDVFIGIGFAVPINVAGGALGSPID